MTAPAEDPLVSLTAARSGSREALGELLERYRNYLLLIAQQEMDPALNAKVGPSDLIQETFLEAQRDFQHFHGHSEPELLAWLRQLLHNNLANLARFYRDTAKRDIQREVPLDLLGEPRADTVTPGEQAAAAEQATRLQDALGRIPADYREVLLLRCRDNCSFEEIGRRLNRSANAAQKLWARAVERLRTEMETHS